jgi:hypothetical protein
MGPEIVGKEVKDIITGVTGIAIGHTSWLTGCNTVGIAFRGLDKDGKMQDHMWFDDSRIEVLGKGVSARFMEKPKKAINGGPSPIPGDGMSIPRQR